MPGRKYSDEQIDRAVEFREAGRSAVEIAAEIGMSRGAVDYYCLKFGAAPEGKPRPAPTTAWRPAKRGKHFVRPFSPEEDNLLLEMEAEGATIGQMARALDRRHNSISGRLMTLARRDAWAEEAA